MKLAKSEVHFVGIGGIGMSGLAELILNMGAKVTGSDLSENSNTQRLRSLGVKIDIGHKKENVHHPDVLVFSSAVRADNPELVVAQQKKIPIIPRAEVLGEVMRLRRGVAVGGTHGKTTTTSMIASIFIHGKLDPTVVVGGRLDLIKSNALLGQSDWVVAEADESDGSFVKLSPEIAVITNIDNDHMEYFKTMENLGKAFVEFALKIPFYGQAVVCGDDPLIRKLFSEFRKRVLFYGFGENNDLVIKGSRSQYQLFSQGKKLGDFDLNIPGKHNALNAAAAIAVGLEAGVSFEDCAAGLRMFVGVDRRFQWKGEVKGVQVFDDYGHHPTEVRAVLQAFREKFPQNRILVLFQPHRYTRTKTCWDEFLKSFEDADQVFISDIYPAGEKPISDISSAQLVSQMKHKNAVHVGGLDAATLTISKTLKSGDVFVTLGAGDVWKVGNEILKK